MNFKIKVIFLLHLLCTEGAFVLSSDCMPDEMTEQIILTEIITNYLKKYLSRAHIFLSLIVAPSQGDQRLFHEEFIKNLLKHPTLMEFSNNILNYLNKAIRHYRNTFNIVFIDSSKSIS